MSKYTFICEPDPDDWEQEGQSKITFTFSDYRLDRMLEEFENFLRASGFHFDGHLEIWEKDEEIDELDDIAELFDEKPNKKSKNK